MDDNFDLEDLGINDDAYIEKVCENAIDYSEYFTTTTIFPSRKAMLDWVIEVGKMHNMVIIIARSQYGEGHGLGTAKATLTCERAGKYRLSKSGIPVDVEKFTGTKKMMCPFRLQAKEHVGGGWSVFVRHGIHNHKLPDYNEGRAIIGKLSKDDLSLVQELSKSHVQPLQIMNILKTVNKKTLVTVKHIYNARQKFKTESLGGRSVMQQLMKLIVDNGYIQWHQEEVGTDVVRDIFFAHPNVISMLRLFHYVLIVDCTYKTNKYKMPFLEIVGMVPTGKNFAIGFAWLKDEQRGSYEWDLSCVKQLFDPDKLPGAIVTDRELALMNAIAIVFPNSFHLLCTRHIQKNVENYVCKLTKNRLIVNAYVKRWQRVVEANTIAMYEKRFNEMTTAFAKMPAILKYVNKSWIIPYRNRFVRSYTMNVLHFGNRTSNRAESGHSSLKCWLKTSTGSLDTIWPKIHSFLESQTHEIKATFQRSQNRDPHVTVLRLFMFLRGKITHKALRLLDNEYKRMESVGVDDSICGCYLRKTHGLPCAHEMMAMEREGRSIQLSDIHPFWKLLNIDDASSQDMPSNKFEFECQHDIDKVLHSYFMEILNQPEDRKKKLAAELEKMIYPEFTSLREPECNENNRGRPLTKNNSTKRDPCNWEYTEQMCSKYSKTTVTGRGRGRGRGRSSSSASVPGRGRSSSCGRGKSPTHVSSNKSVKSSNSFQGLSLNVAPFADDLPLPILPFVQYIHNVIGDGNCGYRAIARWMYEDEHRWPTVRHELAIEIEYRFTLYFDVLGERDCNRTLQSVQHYMGPAPKFYWMSMIDMGFVIATKYNVVVVSWAVDQSLTFLPLVAEEGKNSPERIITLGFLKSSEHFIMIEMKEDSPLPPIYPYWRHHHASVNGWDIPLQSRINQWHKIANVRGR